MPNLYIDRETFKTRCGIAGSTYDAPIMVLLEDLSRAIDNYCNRSFYVEVATRTYDGPSSGSGLTLLLDRDIIAITALATDEDNDGVYETAWAASDFFLLPVNDSPKYSIAVSTRSTGTKLRFNAGQQLVSVAGRWGYAQNLTLVATDVNGAVIAGDAVVNVDNGALFQPGQTILIDSEQLYISSITANALTVTRGVNGTTAAAHADEAAISIYTYPLGVVEALIAMGREAWGRRQMIVQQTVRKNDDITWRDLIPEARPLLAPYRRIAFGAT